MEFNLNEYVNLEEWDRRKVLDKLVEKYRLCGDSYMNHWCFDGDLEELFSDSDIDYYYPDNVLFKAKEYTYDEDTGELLGGMEHDYIETIKLRQNGNEYLCQAFYTECGCGLEYGLALLNICECNL